MKATLRVVGFALASFSLQAQTAEARYAQYLVSETMSTHHELQKMGIHVVPPGGHDEVIVACSMPEKIGKKSSANDLAVEQSGKPAVKTVSDGAFYDLALPLADAAGRKIGMIVMELRFSGAANADDAVAKAQAITNAIESRITSRDALFTTPVPDGDRSRK